MALTSYSELKSAVASWLHRDDLTTQIPDFIALAEADLQVRAKLSQWDTSASVSFTSGVGSLPSDYAQAISLKYGSQQRTLDHLPPALFDGYSAEAGSGEPSAFTVRGSELWLAPTATGDATLNYTARFTALSDSATSNSLLTLFPDAYLNGALMQANLWLENDVGAQKYAALFDASINRIRKYMNEYKYPLGLQMRVVQ